MKKTSDLSSTGVFNGSDFRNYAGGRTNLPGTGFLNPSNPAPTPPTATTNVAPTGTVRTPQTQPQSQTNQTGFAGGLLNALSPSTPQGFGALAGLFRPITEAVLNMGGMPALMSVYGMLSGNQDWKYLTGQSPHGATPPTSPRPPTNVPLPPPPRTRPEYQLPPPPQNFNVRTASFTKQAVEDWINTPQHLQSNLAAPHPTTPTSAGVNLGTIAAARIAAGPFQSIQATTPRLSNFRMFNTGIPGSGGLAAGRYNPVGMLPAAGNIGRISPYLTAASVASDLYGLGTRRWGDATSARAFDESITPNHLIFGRNSPFGEVSTGFRPLDYPLSYATSSLNALGQPVRAADSLGRGLLGNRVMNDWNTSLDRVLGLDRR